MNQPNDSQRDELRERLLEQALRETLGGECPPDLSDRILAAADEGISELPQPVGEGVMKKPNRRRWMWVTVAMTAGVCIGIGSTLVYQASQGGRTPRLSALQMGMHNYHAPHQTMPAPSYVPDDGQNIVLSDSALSDYTSPNARFVHEPDKPSYVASKPVWETNPSEFRQPLMQGGGVQRNRIASMGRKPATSSSPTRPGYVAQQNTGRVRSSQLFKTDPDDVTVRYAETKAAESQYLYEQLGAKGDQMSLASDVPGQTLPSPHYMQDDVQYFPAPEEFEFSAGVRSDAGQVGSVVVRESSLGLSAQHRHELLGKERDQLVKDYARKSAEASDAVRQMETTHTSLAALRKEVEKLRADILTSVDGRDAAVSQLAAKTDEANRLAVEMQTLQEQALLTTEQLADAMVVLRKFKLEAGQGPGRGGDQYVRVVENPFRAVKDHPLSTFSIDVDTASYANVRRFLMQENRLPPPDAVRIEELVNYFDYDYSGPTGDVPFASHIEVAGCPWLPEHRLVRIALKGYEIDANQRPKSNLVFLLDVSGSMNSNDKLPLLQQGMKLLAGQLGENDRVAIVVYAGSEGLVLPSTVGDQRAKVLDAIDRLKSGGSTNGGAGIELAYKIALENFIEEGVNRVILCTDGDFNVGTTSTGDLERMVEEKAKSGVFLSVLGFGRGNLNDAMMETISNKGNGNYAYIDGITEAQKVLVEQMGGTLVTIAKDVKIQVEFNPTQVEAYRLIGYENRMLAAEDFNDDKKDAGEIGAGHTVTALYELVPAGGKVDLPDVDPLRYQIAPSENQDEDVADELLVLKLRYKEPDGDTSELLEFPTTDGDASFSKASPDFQFASSVASFGMLLRGSVHSGMSTYDAVLEIAESAKGEDQHGYRAEFVEMVKRAKPYGEQQAARIEEARKAMEAARESAERAKPGKGLHGVVTYAGRGPKISISLGADDGLSKGQRLDVYRRADADSHVGSIEVVEIKSDNAVCKVLQESDTIAPGDRVVARGAEK